MARSPSFLWFVALVSLAPFAGCVQGGPDASSEPTGQAEFPTTFRVLNATSSTPVFLARVTVLGDGGPIVVVTTDKNGSAPVLVPTTAAGYEVAAAGFASTKGEFD